MTDLEYDGEDYLQTETAGKSKNYGECQPEVFDGTAKPKTQTKHTEDDFQKNWERSSERLLDVFKLGSSLNEIQKAHLPPETVRLAETSWVSVTGSGLLCMACKRAGLKTPWAKGTAGRSSKHLNAVFKTSFLQRHQDSSSHVSAVTKMLDLDEAPGAPTAAEFKEMWKELQDGSSQNRWHGGSWSDKSGLMAWALNESLLRIEQNEMENAETISLQRDARKALLLVKFGFCTTSYHVRSGVLGCRVGGGDRSADVVRSTRQAIRDFCVQFREPPRWYCGPQPVFLEKLYDKIINSVEIVTSDSAANEVVAGTMTTIKIIMYYSKFLLILFGFIGFPFVLLSPGPGLISAGQRSVEVEDDGVTALHPNLKMVGHDKAHSFRRVLKRPYAADPVLEGLMENHCLGKDSMVQVISNSADFRLWFEDCVKTQSASNGTEGFGDKIRNLKAAKHRFESVSTPLGRMLLYLPAFLMTCQKMAEKRKKDKSGQLARQYLEDLTQEQLIQLALLADAGDEGLLLVRAMDHENLDAAEISTHVTAFIDRITALFQHRGALESGYTQHILRLIQQQSLCIFLPNSVRKFGEVDNDVVDRCLERMRSWSRLAMEVLKTEFPSHSLFNSMQIFSLKTERQARDTDCGAEDHFLRLAQVFGVFALALRDQLLRHRVIAENLMREGGLKSRDAWVRTMQRVGKTRLPSDHLGPVLYRYIAWQVA